MLKLLAPETDFTDLEKALESSEHLLNLIKKIPIESGVIVKENG